MRLNLVQLSKQNTDQEKAIEKTILQNLAKISSLNKVKSPEIRESFFGEADYYACELASIIERTLEDHFCCVSINVCKAALVGTQKNIIKAMMVVRTGPESSAEFELNAYLDA